VAGRLAKVWHALVGEEKSDPLDILRDIMGAQSASYAGKSVTLKTAVQVSAAMACARVIAEGIATMPFRVMRQKASAVSNVGLDILPDPSHPLYDKLMGQPNGLQSAFEFKETIGLHLAFVGNAYIWTPRVSGNIDALYPLEPRWLTLRYDFPNLPSYEVRTDDGKFMRLAATEVWHIRGPSWTTYMGLEFVQIAREALGLSLALEEGQARMQGQGVRTSGFISVDGILDADQQAKMRKWLDTEHAGAQNAGRPLILDRASKWVAQSLSNVDAQTYELREMQIEEVCRFMRVMPIMVGVSSKVATYASSEQMFLAHLVHTLGPWVARLESSADRWLLTPEDRAGGRYLKLNEKVLHRMTAADQMNFLKTGAYAGILTRNEARSDLNYNPLPGLDEPLTPVNEVAGPPPTVESMKPPAPAPKPTPGAPSKSEPLVVNVNMPASAPAEFKISNEVQPPDVTINNDIKAAPIHVPAPHIDVHATPPEYETIETEAVRDTKGRLIRTIATRKRK